MAEFDSAQLGFDSADAAGESQEIQFDNKSHLIWRAA